MKETLVVIVGPKSLFGRAIANPGGIRFLIMSGGPTIRTHQLLFPSYRYVIDITSGKRACNVAAMSRARSRCDVFVPLS